MPEKNHQILCKYVSFPSKTLQALGSHPKTKEANFNKWTTYLVILQEALEASQTQKSTLSDLNNFESQYTFTCIFILFHIFIFIKTNNYENIQLFPKKSKCKLNFNFFICNTIFLLHRSYQYWSIH